MTRSASRHRILGEGFDSTHFHGTHVPVEELWSVTARGAMTPINSQIVRCGGMKSSSAMSRTRSDSLSLHQPFVVFRQTCDDELQYGEAE